MALWTVYDSCHCVLMVFCAHCRNLGLQMGLKLEQLVQYGLPIRPIFSKKLPSKSVLRKKLVSRSSSCNGG